MEIIHTITCTASRYLIEKSDLLVKEIAAELGFPEQFTFSKYFKKHAGMSPTEYRRTVGEKKDNSLSDQSLCQSYY